MTTLLPAWRCFCPVDWLVLGKDSRAPGDEASHPLLASGATQCSLAPEMERTCRGWGWGAGSGALGQVESDVPGRGQDPAEGVVGATWGPAVSALPWGGPLAARLYPATAGQHPVSDVTEPEDARGPHCP